MAKRRNETKPDWEICQGKEVTIALKEDLGRVEAKQGKIEEKIDRAIDIFAEESKKLTVAIEKLTAISEGQQNIIERNTIDIRSVNKRIDTIVIGGVAGVAGAVLIMIIRATLNL